MRLSPARIVELERISARAWPAEHTASIGGWLLNASSGWSGRINACWPLESAGLPVDAAVAAAQAWHLTRGLPSLFKIVDVACAPPDLTAHLTAAGYSPRGETLMMIGDARGRAGADVSLGEAVDNAFEAVFAATAAAPEDARERLAALKRVPRPRACARIDSAGAAAAIGACAVEGDWAGVFAMRTDPRHRRQGHARRLLAALLARSAELGAKRAWLQVEAGNLGAIALYAAAGFEEAYRYRYWDLAKSGP